MNKTKAKVEIAAPSTTFHCEGDSVTESLHAEKWCWARSAREAAFSILNRVEDSAAYADILLQETLGKLDVRERALTTELVYGVLRFRLRLDWIIGSFSKIKTDKMETRVLNALRLGVYQSCFLDGVPASAAVDESVKLTKKDGGEHPLRAKKAGFVNAVLRAVIAGKDKVSYPDAKKDPAQFVSIYYSHPLWLVRRWMGRWGVEGTTELCESNLAPPLMSLRTNTLKISRDALLEELLKDGFEVKKSLFSPDGIEAARRGKFPPDERRFYVQDEASQLIAHLVAPKPNETILDACAAPGGKTTHMAAMMKNQGIIWALDKSASRLKSVEETAHRLGANIIKTKQADAEKKLPFEENSFNAILCDAPCSGLGVVRRTPDIKWRIKEGDFKELPGRQKRLLHNLARYLKKGGRLVYSVCSLEPEETEGVIKDFLAANASFALEDAAGFLPASCKILVDANDFLTTMPHKHGCDGFFAARLRKL